MNYRRSTAQEFLPTDILPRCNLEQNQIIIVILSKVGDFRDQPTEWSLVPRPVDFRFGVIFGIVCDQQFIGPMIGTTTVAIFWQHFY